MGFHFSERIEGLVVNDYKIGGVQLDQVWWKKGGDWWQGNKEIRGRRNGGKSGLAYNHWRTQFWVSESVVWKEQEVT